MGNCQAIDTATLVIQHPCGKTDKLYSPITANEVMKMNPGHHVALLITTITTTTTATAAGLPQPDPGSNQNNSTCVRITRVKLLKPGDTLVLGRVYRLISAQEVMKGLMAKRQAKTSRNQPEIGDNSDKSLKQSKENGSRTRSSGERSQIDKTHQVGKTSAAATKLRTWQPSLKSISEAAS